jgi:thiol-disulfide isomerase/thioredoxin
MKIRTSPLRLGMVFAAVAAAGMALAQAEVAVGTAPAPAGPELKIGDKAPALNVAKWVKGTPVKSFEPGKVYVVEFWATWCGPCKQSIPHLTELQKKYAGKVTFNGISVWEEKDPENEEYIVKVEDFVKEWGDKMAYNVAADGKEGIMSRTWMEAAKQGGIPTAFIVNQEGRVAWIGHPMADLDEVLQKVVDGKFDIAAAQAQAAKAAQEEAEMAELFKPLEASLAVGDPNVTLAEVDKILAKKPDVEPMIGPLKFQMLFEAQKESELYAYTEKAFNGYAKDNAQLLNQMAWTIVENADKKLAKPNYELSIKVAERAAELTKNEDAAILDTLAFAHFKKGNYKKAIDLQTKAVALLDKSDYPDEMKAEIKGRLAEFKKKG